MLVLPVVVVLEGAVAWGDIRDLGNLDVREGESVGTIRLDFLVLGLGGGDEDALWLTELTCDYTVGGLGHDLLELLALLGDGVGGGTVLVLDVDDLVGGYVLVDLLHDIGSVLVLDGGHDEMLQVDLVLGFEFLDEAGNVMLRVLLLTRGCLFVSLDLLLFLVEFFLLLLDVGQLLLVCIVFALKICGDDDTLVYVCSQVCAGILRTTEERQQVLAR